MTSHKLQIYPLSQHGIQPSAISISATAIVEALIDHNYKAYIVGGAVRDLLMGLQPKDFDIVTSATPEQIKAVFKKKCRIIGKRFRLAHVYSKGELIEVATFRGDSKNKGINKKNSQIISDNVFGTIEEDAFRRDFSCNALFYDIKKQEVLDYCHGYEHLKSHKLEFIGNPAQRIIEDPARILRAIKFSKKLKLEWDERTQQAFLDNAITIKNVSKPRLFDELVKLFHSGSAENCFKDFYNLGLFNCIFPQSYKAIEANSDYKKLIKRALKNTDIRKKANKSTTPIFLFACFYWPAYRVALDDLKSRNKNQFDCVNKASIGVFEKAHQHIAIPKIIQYGIKNIWLLQHRFQFIKGKKVFVTLENPRFRAAYDFMLLRRYEGGDIESLCDWWTHIQTLSKKKKLELIFPQKKKKLRKNLKK